MLCRKEKKRKRDNERRIGAGLWKEITWVRDLNDILLVSGPNDRSLRGRAGVGGWRGAVRVGLEVECESK